MNNRLDLLLAVVALAGAAGCQPPERAVRHYREFNQISEQAVSPSAPVSVPAMAAGGGASMPDLPAELQTPPLALAWVTPEGWENRGASRMRIGTLVVDGVECTITSFPGDVGGDEANVRRWLGQLNASAEADALNAFISAPSVLSGAAGVPVRVFDFASLLPAGRSPSTLAAILELEGHSVFVKMTGDAAVLARHKAAFEALCASLQLHQEAP